MGIYKNFPIVPFKVGKEGKSLAMILPSAVLKSIKFDPESMYLILKIRGMNSLHLEIIRDIEQGHDAKESMISAQKFTRLPEQTTSSGT